MQPDFRGLLSQYDDAFPVQWTRCVTAIGLLAILRVRAGVCVCVCNPVSKGQEKNREAE